MTNDSLSDCGNMAVCIIVYYQCINTGNENDWLTNVTEKKKSGSEKKRKPASVSASSETKRKRK